MTSNVLHFNTDVTESEGADLFSLTLPFKGHVLDMFTDATDLLFLLRS